MPTTALMPEGRHKYFADNGRPLANGLVYTYAAGTTTPKDTYTDSAGLSTHTNPIVLDAKGEATIFWSGAYKVDVKTAAGVSVLGYPVDNFKTDPAGIWNIFTTLLASAGSSLIGFIQSGAGAVLRTMQAKGRDVKNMADFGVVGDGVTNDTVNWQRAIDAVNVAGGGIIYANRATYSLGIWHMRDNVTLILCPGTTLQCISNILGVNDRFINIDGISNVVIHGNHAVARQNNEYGSGEQRHNVFMVDAHNVTINDLHSDDSGGDAFYIGRNGTGTHCTNITINNCYANGNRRQGGSAVSVDGLLVVGGLYEGTDGTSPQYGWDVEPNDSDDVCRNIRFIGVSTKNNSGGGFLVALKNFVNTADKSTSISLIGCKSDGDCTDGTSGSAALRIAGDGAAWANTLSGSIVVRDFQSINCNRSPIFIQDWDYLKAPHIDIDGVEAVNPNANNTAVQPYDKCGVAVYTSGTTAGVGNFSIRNMRISGANLYTGAYMADTLGAIRNYTLRDVINTAASTTSGFIQYVSASGPNINASVSYTNEQIVSLAVSTGVNNYPGQTIEFPAGGAFTLPSVADVIGQRFIFRNTSNSATELVPDGTETILGWSVGAGGRLVMGRTGDVVILRATSAGWSPEYVSWYARRPKATNVTTPRKIVWASAAPTDGTWEKGDMWINAAPDVGQPTGGRCTVGGTPGTWVDEGNL